ncbi:MAG: 2OG-Fe(II) oxygenase, partial [Fusobacterium sp.]
KSNSNPINDPGTDGYKKTSNINRKSWNIPVKNKEMEGLVSLITECVSKSNKYYFNYDLDILLNLMYHEYYPSKSSALDWHMDLGNTFNLHNRKLSFSIFVNDPNEYEGGNLEIWLDQKFISKIPKDKCGFVSFPSFLLHRVTPITRGIRKSIVGFIGGKPFK